MIKVSEVPGCAGCPLAKKNPNNIFVPIKWGTGLRLAISSAPTAGDAELGEPLVDGAGKWYRGVKRDGARVGGFYWKAGVRDATVSFINVIQCVPPEGKFPTSREGHAFTPREDALNAVHQCVRNHVVPVLKAKPWQRVDLLGDEALEFVGGKTQGVHKWRGSPLAIPTLGEKLIAIPTLHQDDIGKQQELIPVIINDLKKSLTQTPEKYNLYPTLEDVQAFKFREFCFDIETPQYRTMGDHAPIEIVGICGEDYKVLVVPFSGVYKNELKRIFAEATAVIGQNCIQFDLPRLERDGVCINSTCTIYDSMLMQHLRFPNFPHDLEFIGSQFSNKPAWKHQKDVYERYCARDVDVTWQAYKQLKPMLISAQLVDLYLNVQVPLAKICALMKLNGFKQDPNRLKIVRTAMLEEMAALEPKLPEEMRSYFVTKKKRILAPEGTLSSKTGKPVKYTHVPYEEKISPWRSSDVKAKFLYETLALPTQYNAETKQVTVGKDALAKLVGVVRKLAIPNERKAEILSWIETIGTLGRLGTLASGFLKEEYATIPNRVIHPSFNVHGTSTGRLSSSDPNFQNLPPKARYMYVPHHAGWKIIDIDYSGLENRIQAWFSNDTVRLERLNRGINEHKLATSLFFGIPYEDVVKDNDPEAPYNKAKHIVHGTDRGMGARKITNKYGVEFGEAKRMMAIWKDEIRLTIEWQKVIGGKAKRDGVLANPFGRKLWFWTDSLYTESISFMPQSTGADVVYRAMIGLMYERIGWSLEQALRVSPVCIALPKPANLLVQVHDSLVFECPEELVDEVVAILVKVLEQPWKEMGGYKLPVSVAVGDSWGECEPYSLKK